MNDKEKTYVVCGDENRVHTADSIRRSCDICKCGVWCSPHNRYLTPICMRCVRKLKGEKTAGIKRKDLIRAYKIINPDMSLEEFEKVSVMLAEDYLKV